MPANHVERLEKLTLAEMAFPDLSSRLVCVHGKIDVDVDFANTERFSGKIPVPNSRRESMLVVLNGSRQDRSVPMRPMTIGEANRQST